MNHTAEDVINTLNTMLEGDDVDFEPVDPMDPIWDLICFDPRCDEPTEFVNELNDLALGVVISLLIESGFLSN